MSKKNLINTGSQNSHNTTTLISRIYPLLLIFVIGMIIYSNSFDCTFHLDDFNSIIENEAIRNIRDVNAIWNYLNRRFVTYYSFALNYHFHQLEVFGYHLVNVLIHSGASCFVWWLFILILSTPVMRREKISRHKSLIALGGSLLFLTHPIQTQAVTYIVQRLASLAALFYFASLCFYMKARLSKKKRITTLFFAGSALMAFLGMFSKETVFTLPFAVLLFELGFFRSGSPKEILKNKKILPFIIFPLLFTLIIPILMDFNFSNVFGAASSDRLGEPPLTFTVYLLTQFKVFVTYIRLLFVPIHQNVDYDFPASRSFFELPTISSFFLLAAIFITAVWLFPKRKLVSIGIIWFFLTLSVEAVKPLGNVIFEHRLYLPMFGFSVFFVSMIYHIVFKRYSKAGLLLMAGLICVTSFLTYRRNRVWKDEISLWRDAVRKSPDKARPHNNLGIVLSHKGKAEKAIVEFREALSIYPGYLGARKNLGTTLRSLGRYEEAINEYREVLRVNPNEITAYINLGVALSQIGKNDEAVREFRNAIRIKPDYAKAYNNLGTVLLNLGKVEEAISEYRMALRLNPDYTNAYINLGDALYNLGKFDDAVKAYRSALRIDPGNAEAYYNQGRAYFRGGNEEEAIIHFKNALKINPYFRDVHIGLASCYQTMGKASEAEFHLSEYKRLMKESSQIK